MAPSVKHHDTVSVIIAAYNCELTIKQALESLLAQSYTDIEILIGDDASTDRTGETIRSFGDARITVVHNVENLGPGPTRDILLKRARGRWAAFMDADDVMAAERIASLVKIAKRLPDGLLFDDIVECYDSRNGLRPWRRVHGERVFVQRIDSDAHPVNLENLLRSRRLLLKPMIPLAAIRQLKVTHPNLRYGEDGAFFWTLIARGLPAYYLPQAMYWYRITPGSASARPSRHSDLLKCFYKLGEEPLTTNERRTLEWRVKLTKQDLEMAAIWRLPFTKRIANLILYIFSARGRLGRLFFTLIRRVHYDVARTARRGYKR